ncbi:PHB depolymerase [Bdellovibrio sp. NC01]|nr:PHB depolymerase [Bdellovibrio sp. NC01]
MAATLGSYNIDPAGITISGVSSGAYMAVQMQVAYSKTISGAASVAGGIYWCAQGDSQKAQGECMGRPQGINPENQIAKARELEKAGAIDALANLQKQKIYIYASPKDSIINPVNSDKLQDFYAAFANKANIQFVNNINSAHGFPTLNSGNPCQFAMLPWILNCNYDGAGEILKQMYGTLAARGSFVSSHLTKFEQREFGDNGTPLYREGWVYVPEACAQGERCKLHVALHGCQMSPDYIQDKFATLSGFNEWAESNHIIILYPQSDKVMGTNPYACWDWFGFTGQNYVAKDGKQMSALFKMIERLSRK